MATGGQHPSGKKHALYRVFIKFLFHVSLSTALFVVLMLAAILVHAVAGLLPPVMKPFARDVAFFVFMVDIYVAIVLYVVSTIVLFVDLFRVFFRRRVQEG